MSSRRFLLVLLMLAVVAGAASVDSQTLDSVSPGFQRVGELITLEGSGFGAFVAGTSRVELAAGADVWPANSPYVWRDDFIQVWVPAGKFVSGNSVPVSKDAVDVRVVTAAGTSNGVSFRVAARDNQPLPPVYVEMTEIVGDRDVSNFLGNPDFNLARTKDGEVADIDGDGWIDLLDNNSNNLGNDTFSIFRRNLGGAGFQSIRFEPRDSDDSGVFAMTVPNGGTYSRDFTTYDGDLMDLTNDGLPDWVQALRDGTEKIRVAVNNFNGQPGRFVEATGQWVQSSLSSGSPDDVAHVDANLDGWVDVAVAFRFADVAQVLMNLQGIRFADPVDVEATGGAASVHDVFFMDVNADEYADVILVNESGDSKIFLNDTDATPTWSFFMDIEYSAQSGAPGDFNADGVMDFVLGGTEEAAVFMNNPNNPGNFSQIDLPSPGQTLFYDVEVGDINLDGLPDVIASAVPLSFGNDPDDTVRIWVNRGEGTFRSIERPSNFFPGLEGYQRMSADLIDFDNDGDLDFYITGADGTGITGFGDVANQFWINQLID